MGKSDGYKATLKRLQIEMVQTQAWLMAEGRRVLVVLEGRDTAGKDGAIRRMTAHMAPRHTRVVALPKPTDRETTQWYFQRYTPHFPAAGEFVVFNRSWYNRGGVEPVMGFCTPDQHAAFLEDAPEFEDMLTRHGIALIKLWLDISREEQADRLEARREDPLKKFKISALDGEAQARWDDYSTARDQMLWATHTGHAPWTIVATDRKKDARIGIMSQVLSRLERPDRDEPIVPDPDIVFPFHEAEGRMAP